MLSKLRNRFGTRLPSAQVPIYTTPPAIEDDMDPAPILALLQPLIIPGPNKKAVPVVWTAILPPEIIYHLIDTELCDSVDTLQNLALTCRNVRTYAQRYLFQRIDLDDGDFWSRPWSKVIKFLLVIHQHPGLLYHIQMLSMTLRPSGGNEEKASRRITLNTMCLTFIIQQPLPNLKDFRLTLYSWVHPSPEFQRSLSSLLKNPKLTKLALLGAGIHAMSPLRYTTSNVVDLSISNFLGQDTTTFTPNAADSEEEPPSSLPALTVSKMRPKILTLHGPSSASAVLHAEYCDYSQLSTFRFYGGQSGGDLPFINRYLKYFSSTLTNLELYTANQYGYVGGTAQPNFAALFKLQNLTIKIPISCDDVGIRPESAAQFNWLINALNSLPTPCVVENICIMLYDPWRSFWEILDWDLFDGSAFRTEGKWTALKTLEILFVSETDWSQRLHGTTFQNRWLPEKLKHFRKTTNAWLIVKFVTLPRRSEVTTSTASDDIKSDPKYRWYYY